MSSRIRRKRSDTKVGSVEKRYGIDLRVRSDMKLGKFLEAKGFSSLSKALREANKAQRRTKR